MKRSERLLLGVFGLLFIVIVGGGALTFGINHYRDIQEESARLTDRLIEMNQAVTEGSEWQRRSDWLEAHVPSFPSRQEASSKLLDALQKEAEKAGVTLTGREFLEKRPGPEVDGADAEPDTSYFDQATVRVTLTGAREQALFAWMHALQQPERFLGVTRLQINPSGQGKTVHVEAEVTQFYREKPAGKLTSAQGGKEP